MIPAAVKYNILQDAAKRIPLCFKIYGIGGKQIPHSMNAVEAFFL